MGRRERKRVSIDFRLQGSLCFRVAVYWVSCICVVGALFAGRMALTDSPDLNFATVYGRPLLYSLFVLPLAIFDALVYSNKFAGPMFRFRTELKKLVNGEKTRTIHFRKGDFFQEIADDFNTLLKRFEDFEKNADVTGAEKPTEDREDQEAERQTVKGQNIEGQNIEGQDVEGQNVESLNPEPETVSIS